MRAQIHELMRRAAQALTESGFLGADLPIDIQITRTRDPSHGDFACNLAMTLAKAARKPPRQLAEALVGALPDTPLVTKVEIAGPGFINFHLSESAQFEVVRQALDQGRGFGRSNLGAGRRIQVEFVSANPTGPLHVGHGRGAAYGATVANLLSAVGFDVQREYYVNDAGRQMNILGASVWLRYLELCGEALDFPSNGYKGDYVWDIAATLHREHGQAYFAAAADVFADLPADAPKGGDKEEHVDAVIERARELLGENRWRFVFELGLNAILDDIRDDLEKFGVSYDCWFSERSLTDSGAVTRAIERLRENNWLYEKDGAWWFRSTDFGDEKDRVVIRDNGQTTYFASDIAYHMDKMERGFERVIDVWGADHHGYIPRVKAALQALGYDPARLDVLLVQFAILYRNGEKQQMSTRSGEFVTLRELRKDVGNDAARFFYVMRRCEQHMDFDLDLARSQSNDNPVYYAQYAHARICSVFRQAAERGIEHDAARGLDHLTRLREPHETDLLTQLARYPEVVESAATSEEPHQVVHHLRELANALHTYYNAHQFLVEDPGLRDARLCLVAATRQTLANALELLGVSAPETM